MSSVLSNRDKRDDCFLTYRQLSFVSHLLRNTIDLRVTIQKHTNLDRLNMYRYRRADDDEKSILLEKDHANDSIVEMNEIREIKIHRSYLNLFEIRFVLCS